MLFSFQLFVIFTIVLCTSALTPLKSQRQIAGSAGCGKKHWFNGITQYDFGLMSSGRKRSYSIHLPADYNETSPYATVLGFHGSQSVGLFFEADTRMSEARYSSGVSCPFFISLIKQASIFHVMVWYVCMYIWKAYGKAEDNSLS